MFSLPMVRMVYKEKFPTAERTLKVFVINTYYGRQVRNSLERSI